VTPLLGNEERTAFASHETAGASAIRPALAAVDRTGAGDGWPDDLRRARGWGAVLAGRDARRVSSIAAHLAVQVLLEDLAIAILFVRAAAVGPRAVILGVAALFAAGHVPALLARGEPGTEFVGLLRDFDLGVLVVGTAWRGADIAWVWPVHYTMDMTQFLGAAR
jgi:hypothetical protein